MWSMEQFSTYIEKHHGKKGYVQAVLEPRIQQIMLYCFEAAKPQLSNKFGCVLRGCGRRPSCSMTAHPLARSCSRPPWRVAPSAPASSYFDLLGFDFMIDTNFDAWLIEANVNPALHTSCKPCQCVQALPCLCGGNAASLWSCLSAGPPRLMSLSAPSCLPLLQGSAARHGAGDCRYRGRAF